MGVPYFSLVPYFAKFTKGVCSSTIPFITSCIPSDGSTVASVPSLELEVSVKLPNDSLPIWSRRLHFACLAMDRLSLSHLLLRSETSVEDMKKSLTRENSVAQSAEYFDRSTFWLISRQRTLTEMKSRSCLYKIQRVLSLFSSLSHVIHRPYTVWLLGGEKQREMVVGGIILIEKRRENDGMRILGYSARNIEGWISRGSAL